jgi:cytochrome c-type biogenesis protein CcmH/NrfG
MSDSGSTSLGDIEALIATDPGPAVQRLRRLLTDDPMNAAGYRLLARALERLEARSNSNGDVRTRLHGADSLFDRAAAALGNNDFATTGPILRDRLLERPTDVDALCLLAELAYELHHPRKAEDLLRLAIEIAPGSTYARVQLARLLDREQRPLEARQELEPVLAREPDNLFAKAVYAAALGRTGQYDEAAELYEELLRKLPDEPSLWSTYGYILQTMGRTDEAVRAMRRATQLAPNNGEAWWTLANVKTHGFDGADIAAMRAALGHDGLGDHDRLHIHFALGKAYEDSGDAAEAFGNYDRANAIRRRSAPYDPAAIAA